MFWHVDWLRRCNWDSHTRMFREELVVQGSTVVAMELQAHVAYDIADELWRAWRRIEHPNVLAISSSFKLRFAAIDWTHAQLSLREDLEQRATAATWGVQLVDVYDQLSRTPGELGWFSNPITFVDLVGNVRLAFATPKRRRHVPPEHRTAFPASDERGAIYIVGRTLAKLVSAPSKSKLGRIIARCIARDREARFTSLAALRDALADLDFRALEPAYSPTWDLLEPAIGWLSVDDMSRAYPRIRDALALEPDSMVAAYCCLELARRLGVTELTAEVIESRLRVVTTEDDTTTDEPSASVLVARRYEVAKRERHEASRWREPPEWSDIAPPETRSAWGEVVARGAALEAARDFGAALALYRTVRPANVESEIALSRCSFEVGNFSSAVGHARRAIALEPGHIEAVYLVCRALVRASDHATALVETDRWLELAANDARAHYSRGKCLLGLGRLVDARAAFDRAIALDGKLVEALLLRREVDRMTKTLRATVGTAQPELEVPEHLTALRPLLAAGNFAAAIDQLLGPDHARDVAAQLLLAGLLSSLRRNDEVIAVCDRVLALDPPNAAARVTKAYALLDLQRASEALELFEAVGSAAVEATAGRARCLLELGREAEARAAFDEYVRLSAHGADLRVRSGAAR